MSEQTAQATREELTRRCGHECLNQPDHDGPHFYGYRMGQYSYEGLLAEIERLRALLPDADFLCPDCDCYVDADLSCRCASCGCKAVNAKEEAS